MWHRKQKILRESNTIKVVEEWQEFKFGDNFPERDRWRIHYRDGDKMPSYFYLKTKENHILYQCKQNIFESKFGSELERFIRHGKKTALGRINRLELRYQQSLQVLAAQRRALAE
jgi:hypothetical protein